MKVSVIWAVALLAVACGMQAQSNLLSNLPSLDGWKEKLEKMKDHLMKTKPASMPSLDEMSKDVTKKVMAGVASISSSPIKDPKALQGFVNHIISTHAEGMLSHHNKTAQKIIADVRNYAKKYNVKVPATISWTKMSSSMARFCVHQFYTYNTEFHAYLVKFNIKLKSHTSHQAFKDLLMSIISGNDYSKTMKNILQKYGVVPIPPFTNNMMEVMKKEVQRISETSRTELDKVLKTHGLTMPNEGLSNLLVKMVEHNLQAHMVKKPTTIEENLKNHFNQAMDLMHKAFGSMDSDSMHSMMESIRKMVPHMLDQHIRKMKHQLQQKGQHESYAEILKRIGEKTRKLRPTGTNRMEERHEHHQHHNRKKLYMAIFIPIGAILIIALISTLIYCMIKSKRSDKDSSEKFEKPPTKKVNPYAHFDDPRCVSKA